MRKKWLGIALMVFTMFLTGCMEGRTSARTEVTVDGESEDELQDDELSEDKASTDEEQQEEDQSSATDADDSSGAVTEEDVLADDSFPDDDVVFTGGTQKKMLHFVDVFQNHYEVEINPNIEATPYDDQCFFSEGNKVMYEDANYTSRQGVDVSHHQGAIDWARVKAAGYDFAFIRIGYRGYGTTGSVNLDREFYNNLKGAQAAGIDVGVYFFSQAISKEEAIEEAEFVLDALKGVALELPVVFDPENILDDVARTDNVSGEQFTENTIAFCERIRQAGYEPMIYSNMLWEAYTLDLEQLSAYPVWYADYEPLPQTPYHYVFWQYDNKATVPGISGETDVNLQMMPRA